jgi:hypothetical protein
LQKELRKSVQNSPASEAKVFIYKNLTIHLLFSRFFLPIFQTKMVLNTFGGEKIMDEEKAWLIIVIIMSYLRDYIFSFTFISVIVLLFNSPYNLLENVIICAVLSVIPIYRDFEEIRNNE